MAWPSGSVGRGTAVSPTITTVSSSSTDDSYADITVTNCFDVPLDTSGKLMLGGIARWTANLSLNVNG